MVGVFWGEHWKLGVENYTLESEVDFECATDFVSKTHPWQFLILIEDILVLVRGNDFARIAIEVVVADGLSSADSFD